MLIFAAAAGAQSNATIDRLLGEKQAVLTDAAYIILAAGNLVKEDATADQVLAVIAEKKLLPGAHGAADHITLGETSYLIMEVLGMQGGLLYLAFPGPRYAAREMQFLRLIPSGYTHPDRIVSGQEVMQMLGAAMEKKGDK
jgi:hypothetical protein